MTNNSIIKMSVVRTWQLQFLVVNWFIRLVSATHNSFTTTVPHDNFISPIFSYSCILLQLELEAALARFDVKVASLIQGSLEVVPRTLHKVGAGWVVDCCIVGDWGNSGVTQSDICG